MNFLEFNGVVLPVVGDVRQRGACSDFVDFEDLPAQSSNMLIEVVSVSKITDY
jgi:hypothetical protein